MPTCTHAAHDVKPYTNSSGKYVIMLQHRRSTLRAQLRRRMARDGDDGGEGEPNVAMLARRRGRKASASVYGLLDAAGRQSMGAGKVEGARIGGFGGRATRGSAEVGFQKSRSVVVQIRWKKREKRTRRIR